MLVFIMALTGVIYQYFFWEVYGYFISRSAVTDIDIFQ